MTRTRMFWVSVLLLPLVAIVPGPDGGGVFFVAALGKKPTPPRKQQQQEESIPVIVSSSAAAVYADPPLRQKAIGIVGAVLAATFTDHIVHNIVFANETVREELTYKKGKYKDTLLFAAADSIDVGAKAYALTLITDVLSNIFPAIKNSLPFGANLHRAAPRLGILVWAVKSASAVKHLFLKKLVHGRQLGKVAFLDRITDIGLVLTSGYVGLNLLEYKMGVNINSFFAASGVSAIVMTLAFKGMVEQLVNGLLLQAWDAIEIGEKVRLGDGTEGTVVRIGLLETEVVGGDHVPVRVPNSQIVGKRVHMFSKVSKSKIKQTLRFKYGDLHKLHQLLDDIQAEIQTACASKMIGEPEVLLTNYEADHIQVSVSASFDFRPDSSEYDHTKQRALFAIADAMKKNDVDFAIPAIQYETNRQSSEILS